MPRLVFDTNRFALEEAKAAPTDAGQAGIVKRKFDITPMIGGSDVLFTIRSDDSAIVQDVLRYLRSASSTLNGVSVPPPNLPLTWSPVRAMFSQPGLPRRIAEREGLYYADRINDQSPMWMGFADQQTSSTGPAAACTFAGNASSQLTTARQGDYFDNGGIQNLLARDPRPRGLLRPAGEAGSAEDETFLERVQYMFRSDPPPSFGGGGDPFLNGGGPAYLPSTFAGTGDAALGAQGVNTPGIQHRIGHLGRACSSRPGPRTARRCTSGWTVPASTSWTCRTRSSAPAAAGTCRSCSSPRSYRRPTSSTRCGATRRRSTCRLSSRSTRSTTAWNGSSPRPGGRTSSARPDAIGPSRWSS
jgi:hypothetical protein